MPYTYRLRKDTVYDEGGKEYVVYGIEAVDAKEHVLACFSDLFFDRQKAAAFVDLCNECDLDIIHLPDVAADAMTVCYSVLL